MAKLIGEIKWFGGYNVNKARDNDFGFIMPATYAEDDIYVHKNQVKCPSNKLYEGVKVVYEVGNHKGRVCALNVELLSEITDSKQLKLWMLDTNTRPHILMQFLKTIDTVEKLKAYVQEVKDHPRVINDCLVKINDKIILNNPMLLPYVDVLRRFQLLCSPLLINATEFADEFKLTLKSFMELSYTYTSSITDDILNRIFELYHVNDLEYLEHLPIRYVKSMVKKFNTSQDEELLEEIVTFLSIKSYTKLTDYIPIELLKYNSFYTIASPYEQMEYLRKTKTILPLLELEQLFEKVSATARYDYLDCVGSTLSDLDFLRKYLAPQQQAILFDPNTMEWDWLTNKAKIYYFYKLASQKRHLPTQYFKDEKIPLIKFIGQMALPKGNPERTTFLQLDNALNRTIVANFNSKLRIDMLPILPRCDCRRIDYCEGRHWYEKGASNNPNYLEHEAPKIYCPRARTECPRIQANGTGHARLYPNLLLSWQRWSMVEYMACYGMKANLPRLKDPHEYLTRIGGWANRMDELLEHAKCRECGKVMKADIGYARRFDAVYNATIFNCRDEGITHDKNIYMNHCWACRSLIDSRKSKIRHEGMYLCLHCGHGPKHSSSFSVGDICPNCGNKPMHNKLVALQKGITDTDTCTKCGHMIYPVYE